MVRISRCSVGTLHRFSFGHAHHRTTFFAPEAPSNFRDFKPRFTAAIAALRFSLYLRLLPISAFKSEGDLSDEFTFRRYSSAIRLSRSDLRAARWRLNS